MAKQTGKFVDDSCLHPRDNSGPGFDQGGEFGDAGKSVGGKPSNNRDEMKAPTRRGGY